MSLRKHALAPVIYPETDGKPMAETELHAQLMLNLLAALKNHFADQPDVYVWGNMFMYYVEDDPRKNVAPDVFVVRGVGKRLGEQLRRTYKIWEEGAAPCVIIEITSSETRHEDLRKKKQLYADLGVREYYVFDPEYHFLKPHFRAYRLQGSQYVDVAVFRRRVHSAELGLDLVDTGETLRLFNPAAGAFLPTPEELLTAQWEAEAHAAQAEARAAQAGAAREQAERARLQAENERLQAENERLQEAAARHRAEAEAAQLRAELARLKRKPAGKKSKP